MSLAFYFFKDFIYLREREHEQGEEQRERDKQTLHSVRNPTQGLISQP